jgi:hypothetical protein
VEVMDVGHSGAGPSLSSSPKGAYTITRSNSDGSTILLWIGTVDVASGRGHAKQVFRPPASVSTLKTPHLSISSDTWGSCLTKFFLSTLAPTPKPQCQEAKALNLEHWR